MEGQMLPHLRCTHAIGLAAGLTLGAVSPIRAQVDTARQRVPVVKERPAPPRTTSTQPVRKDSIKPDTIRQTATGEVVTPVPKTPTPAPTPAPTPVAVPQAPTAPVQAVAPPPRTTQYLVGNTGLFLGFGGAIEVPYNTFSNLGYQPSYGFAVPFGWRPVKQRFGIRAFFGYDQAHAHISGDPGAPPAEHGSAPDPKIYTVTGDLLYSIPLMGAVREGRGVSLYTLAGGGVYLFRGFGGTDPLSSVLGIDEIGNSKRNVHKWGANVGAGLEWGLGPTALFFESRFVNVFTTKSGEGNRNIRWIPIAAGVTVR
jgi:hypothetical protein